MAVMMAAVLALVSVACNPDEKEGFDQMDLTEQNAILIENFNQHDATAAYPLTLSIKLNAGYLEAIGGVSKATNTLVPSNIDCLTDVLIADCGKKSSLKSVTELPTFGTDKKVPIEEKHAYVVKAWGAQNLDSYTNDQIHDPAPMYVRIYVAEALETGGFKIYYQYPFVPEK